MAPSLIDRAEAWQGGLEELAQLSNDIGAAFYSIASYVDQDEVRLACEELVASENLPKLHRAQFLVYMAATEEDDAEDAIREHLDDAKHLVNDLKSSIRDAIGTDTRVEQLDQTIDALRSQLEEDSAASDDLPIFEDKLQQPEETDQATNKGESESKQTAEAHTPLTLPTFEEKVDGPAEETRQVVGSDGMEAEVAAGGNKMVGTDEVENVQLLAPGPRLKSKSSIGSLRGKNVPKNFRRNISNASFQALHDPSLAMRPKPPKVTAGEQASAQQEEGGAATQLDRK